jgi:hypothetical protein
MFFVSTCANCGTENECPMKYGGNLGRCGGCGYNDVFPCGDCEYCVDAREEQDDDASYYFELNQQQDDDNNDEDEFGIKPDYDLPF